MIHSKQNTTLSSVFFFNIRYFATQKHNVNSLSRNTTGCIDLLQVDFMSCLASAATAKPWIKKISEQTFTRICMFHSTIVNARCNAIWGKKYRPIIGWHGLRLSLGISDKELKDSHICESQKKIWERENQLNTSLSHFLEFVCNQWTTLLKRSDGHVHYYQIKRVTGWSGIFKYGVQRLAGDEMM